MHAQEQRDGQRRATPGTPAPGRGRGRDGSARPAAAAAGGRADALSPAGVLALQRSAGNGAVAAALGGPSGVQRAGGPAAVQRAGGQEEREPRPERTPAATSGPTGLVGGGSDLVTPGTGADVGPDFRNPAVSTDASYGGGVAGPFGVVAASGVNLGISARGMHTAGRGRRAAQPGSAQHQAHSRDYAGAAGDTAQNASSFTANALHGTGGAMNLSGNYLPEIYNGALTGGGFAALPGALVQAVRYSRKAHKAGRRVDRLRETMGREDQVQRELVLAAAREEIEATRELVRELEEYHTFASSRKAEIAEGLQACEGGAELPDVDLAAFQAELGTLGQRVERAREKLAAAEERRREQDRAQAAVERALTEVARQIKRYEQVGDEEITLRVIQGYALAKNQRGRLVKAIMAMSGALAASGAVASLVATIAITAGAGVGAAALMATPVGWALAATAATAALGVGSYRAWQFFAHRWAQTAGTETGGEAENSVPGRLKKTLRFWRPTGPKPRERLAAALYQLASDPERSWGQETAEELGLDWEQSDYDTSWARETVADLGLDWERLRGDRESAVKLIAAKLAS
ncbi:hypothetical protein [Streptomyces lycii]|uniref:Uncharacterized protein n=1 Tax=Streptomyces lycii TaxID=2654337 RepID=A0ABQ7FDD5_9ACTN|nr:hypothetical protein [Streptomyces lycii]KAF4405709.1 hypothetical protein GCU69_28365 [Streptomyces lycii]